MHETYLRENALQPQQGYDVSLLRGKSVVVTGGASGLGEEITRQFVQEGAFVTIADLSRERGEQIATELGADNAAFVQCNVLHWNEQVEVFKTAVARSPNHQIDIVVANAGIGGRDTIWQNDAPNPDDEPIQPDLNTLQTNLTGVMYTTKLAIHYLSRNKPGDDRCLIMTASLAAYVDQPGATQYNAAKWGVRGLMRTLRRTSPALGIRVNMLSPWYIRTRILGREIEGALQAEEAPLADKRDVGAAALHLACDGRIHGRSIGIIPREIAPEGKEDLQPTGKGYIDLERDDFPEGDTMTEWQDTVLQAYQRLRGKK